jgi:hypothetical protein
MNILTILQGILLLAFAIFMLYAALKLSNMPDPDAEQK